VNRRFLCRRRRKSPSSRQRFLPHPERLGGSFPYLASMYRRVPRRTRRSQAPTSQPRPKRAWPCPSVFASASASPVTLANPLDCLACRPHGNPVPQRSVPVMIGSCLTGSESACGRVDIGAPARPRRSDDANKVELWDSARIGLPSTFTDDAKRDGNHSRACEEVWSANRQGLSVARARQSCGRS
jgi:hypothetical protein